MYFQSEFHKFHFLGPDMNNIPPKVMLEPEFTPITGENWQCRVCRNFFPTKDRILKHLQEIHDMSTHAKMKKNIERFMCT